MLASPIIEGTLPAFYLDENGIAQIAIPFSMSRAVNKNQIKGFKLKIKNVQQSNYLITLSQSSVDFIKSIVYFNIPKETLEKSFLIGQFYKCQLAYIDINDVTGYYSTVGVIKYTTKPKVSILTLAETGSNSHIYTYTGLYSQYERDFTEKVYSYRFILKDEDNNILKDTDFITHNNSNDELPYESQDIFTYTADLDVNKKYYLSYIIRTNNMLEISSPSYKIVQKKSIMSDLEIEKILPVLNYNNGYIEIQIEGKKDFLGNEKPARGFFILSRASEKSNYMDWEKISEFSLVSERPSIKKWKDFTIEQGVHYKYSIQQFNSNLYSDRIVSDEIVYADFEDCFLYDGKRQLKIKFNPKVSSFKKDVLETKVDTLGSKYPFIFKNGQVEYKEFPISGLISYLSDEENLFLDYNHQDNSQREENNQNSLSLVRVIPSQSYFYENDNFMSYFVKTTTSIKQNYQFLELEDYINSVKTEKYNEINEDIKNAVLSITNLRDKTQFNNIRQLLNELLKSKNRLYQNLYMQKSKNIAIKTFNTDLTSENIRLERQFKLEVLDWLTNGEPKLFKSPNEGNYIVRLLNVSLTPNDQLGRMIHTFNATAYEVADLSYDNLCKLNIIDQESSISNTFLKFTTIPLATKDYDYANLKGNYIYDNETGTYYATGDLLKTGVIAQGLKLNDIEPGTIFKINNEYVVIGSTGNYEVPVDVYQISLENNQKSYGSITFSYISEISSSFNSIINLGSKDIFGKQKIGKVNNLINEIEDIQTKLISFYDIKFYERPVEEALYQEEYIKVENSSVNFYNYMNYYILKDEKYIIPETYSYDYEYYKRIYNLLNYNNEIIASFEWQNNGNQPVCVYQNYDLNNLFVYKYIPNTPILLQDLYVKIRIEDTGNQDKYNNSNRDLTNRTATNKYLYDIRDLPLLARNQMIYISSNNEFILVNEEDINIKYDKENGNKAIYYINGKTDPNPSCFIKNNIEYIFVPDSPNQLYLTKTSYNEYNINILNDNNFDKLIKCYESNIMINNIEFNLSEIKYYQTGELNTLFDISQSVGVYSELFYQVQTIDYDVSQNYDLSIMKKRLEEYDYKLSKEYMLLQCNNGEEINYINTIYDIREKYPILYNNYILALEQYLQTLNKEE